ncbi:MULTISPECIES: IS982 family transposase [unclassified Streptomyces]|uniref:IS982 family transposase n=1 Tax=unclassified Streptomyces TaxID=2593676 RepID=UPI000DAD8BB4|nr:MULTISPECIES: IS982 family transposase [unclassified Streptomyces]PZT72332.1 IS982 family transposase [Streptomyces sp. AC1-42T]PZT73857.1 IS982 family transposase [Streptomyces sp. AC1-42T]PZT74948.1 IS982 family transposase [Streptomyces sp. AC1-42T]PZT77549.1 IS982 family transposase [Streptomyces sp. AC1-42W]PZT81346.1 IS982 family transposase [Streptomyces sp. AC1-42W]
MTNEDLDALITGLYVKIDDEIGGARCLGRPPQLSDSELVCLAVAQSLLGFASEARWLRFAHGNLSAMFPYLPKRPGYNKRLRAALPLVKKAIRMLAVDTDFWFDNQWIVDSTPVPCGMSRPTVKRSDMAGWAGYGYCASHSRFYWGLRLFLVCTPTGMPITWALASPKIDEREVLAAMLDREPDLTADRPGLLVIADKGFASKEFETDLAFRGAQLLRPSFKREKRRKGESLLKSVRQLIESVNDTLKGQLDLEQHGGRTFEGVAVRVAQRILAMAAAIWHNHKTGAPVLRSLTAFDH